MTKSKKKSITPILLFGAVCALIFLIFFYFYRISPPQKPQKATKKHHIPTSPTPILPQKIKLPIITYHYIENVQDPGDTIRKSLDINPFVFESQLKQLQETGYSSYFVSDIPKLLSGKEPFSKGIVLTFDDGYEDFYINAFPMIKKYQFKATVYIIVNFIGRRGFMTESEIRDIIQSGLVEVGAHSLNHLPLASVSIDKARSEIFDSKQRLEDMFGIQVKTFAYPGGSYNDKVADLVKEASYEAAVSTKPGVYLTKDRLFTLPRLRSGYLFLQAIQSFFGAFKKE